MRVDARLCAVLLAACAAARAEGSQPASRTQERSYELFRPSAYSAARPWPIVYVFDPAAQGSRPVALMRDAAERHGYLIAASNRSRNGPWRLAQEAAAEMWSDTHARLAIDERRVYFAGFSGGARVSAQLAQLCGCARGVFLDGAGFSTGSPPSRHAVFEVFAAAGLADFNYGELVELDARLEGLGFRHALRRFEGAHSWAPPAVWEDAFAWSALLEMRDGLRDRDAAFVAGELARTLEAGRAREERGERAYALEEYRAMEAALAGLVDTAALSARIDSLRADPAVRRAVAQEEREIARQRSLEDGILEPIRASSPDASDWVVRRAEAIRETRQQRRQLEAEKPPEDRRVAERVLGGVFVGALESGRRVLDAGETRRAMGFFDVAAEARPDSAAPPLSLARCHAHLGDEKAALRDLKRAVENGLDADHLAAFVASEPKLERLARSEAYRRLLAPARPPEATP